MANSHFRISTRFLALPVVVALLAVGCSKEDTPVSSSSLTLSTAIITVSAEGGECGFTYSGGSSDKVECGSSAGWLGGFEAFSSDGGFSGEVNFVVEANLGGQRSAEVTLSASSLSATVTVVQEAAAEPVVVPQTSVVAAPAEGGACSFQVNGAEGCEVSCSANEEWVSSLTAVSSDTSVTVEFHVAENDTGQLRSAEIMVECSAAGGSAVTVVTVVQDYVDADIRDVSYILGTYVAWGQDYYYSTVTVYEEWEIVVYENEADDGYDVLIDGLTPLFADGFYKKVYSARAWYKDGRLIIPTQVLDATISSISGDVYYFGYTPVVEYSSYFGFFDDIGNRPDLTFVYRSAQKAWVSDYGVFGAGFLDFDLDTFSVFFDAVTPAISMVKVTDDTY